MFAVPALASRVEEASREKHRSTFVEHNGQSVRETDIDLSDCLPQHGVVVLPQPPHLLPQPVQSATVGACPLWKEDKGENPPHTAGGGHAGHHLDPLAATTVNVPEHFLLVRPQ